MFERVHELRWCRGLGILLLAFGSTAQAAEGETREARHTLYQDKGVYNKPGMMKPCKEFSREEIRLTFPIAGGAVRGTWKHAFQMALDMDKSKDKNSPLSGVMCLGGGEEDPTEYEISGTYDGKDGGLIRATCRNVKKNESKACSGRIFAAGNGTFRHDADGPEHNLPLSFPPFGECNLELNSYGRELRSQLLNALIDAASKYTFQRLKGAANELRAWTREMAILWRIRTDRYADLLDALGKKPPLSVFERMEREVMNASVRPGAVGKLVETPVWKVVREVGENASKGMALVQVANNFIEGQYGEGAITVFIEGVGIYSNVAGLAAAAAKATYDDWVEFEKRYAEKEFKELYRKVYYDGGGRPKPERWRAERTARLRHFIEEVYDWLDYGGLQGDRLRKVLIEFAAGKLEMKLSRADLKLVDKEDGGRTFADRRAVAVLGALFLEFESVFEKDAEAELLRQLSERATRRMGDRAKKAEDGLQLATTGDFSGVWPELDERKRQMCKVIQTVLAGTVVKPAATGR